MSSIQTTVVPESTTSVRPLSAPILCIYLLSIVTFSAPGREGPSGLGGLDLIAMAKLGVRAVTLLLLGNLILRLWSYSRRSIVQWCMFPAFCFLAWSLLSVVWSPLKAISLGQSSGLMVQLLLTFALGVLAHRSQDHELILFHLSMAMLLVSSIVLAAFIVSPELSGLKRGQSGEGSMGIVHPTSAGATAGIGLLTLWAIRLLWDADWIKKLILPGSLVHGVILWLAMSRTALGLTAILLMLLITMYLDRKVLAQLVLLGSCFGLCFLMVDPVGRALDQTLFSASDAVTRGESTESMSSLTGRTALWEEVLKEHQKSPWIGHGYFVTSTNGLLDVWGGPANRTAHNLLLQVLSSTGLVGLMFFLWAAVRALVPITSALKRENKSFSPLPQFLLWGGLWYLGWSQLCVSFMGPIQPESVCFFTLLGLALGQVRPTMPESTGDAHAQ